MSYDFCMWKWKSDPKISPGLCCLYIYENAECEEVELLDTEAIKCQINAAFPGWFDTDSEYDFYCNVLPTGITLQTYTSTPQTVIDRFRNWAKENGFVFFDLQVEEIPGSDLKEFKTRMASIRTELDARIKKENFPELEARAKAGGPKALVKLGNRYSFGEVTGVNFQQAFICYQKAARAGDPDGMYNLAACYKKGEGTAADIQQAIYWYQKADEQGELFASMALGEIYSRGIGIQRDTEKAVSYYQKALDNGISDARKALRALGALPALTLLKLENKAIFEDPGAKDIEKALKTLKPEGNSFAILERSDFGFVKAAVTPVGDYCLEYRENFAKQGFRCKNVPFRKILRLFQQCAAGNYDWKKKLNWHQVQKE